MSTIRDKGTNIPVDPADNQGGSNGNSSSGDGSTLRNTGHTIPADTGNSGGDGSTLHDPGNTISAGAGRSSSMANIVMGSSLTLGNKSYRVDALLSHSSGEAEIFLISDAKGQYVLKRYYPNFKPKDDVVDLIKSINHPNIVGIIDSGWYQDYQFYEIMQYQEGGSLEKCLPVTDIDQLKTIIRSVTGAFDFFHSKGLIHKDIKPSNLYLRQPGDFDVLLGDFGISIALDENRSRQLSTQNLTPGFAAPELVGAIHTNRQGSSQPGKSQSVAGKEVDYYALGISLIMIWLGEDPFKGLANAYIVNLTVSGNVPIPDDLPADLAHLIKGLITVDYTQRWGYHEVQRWLQGEHIPIYFQRYDSSVPPYQFKHELFAHSTEELAQLLKSDTERAVTQLYRGTIADWVNQFNQGLAAELEQLVEADYAVKHGPGLEKAIFLLDHNEPYRCPHAEEERMCRNASEIASAMEDEFERYSQALASPDHRFYLYLEAHEAKALAETFRNLFKTFSGRKALQITIFELLGKNTLHVNGREVADPQALLSTCNEDLLDREFRDQESRVSLWIAWAGFKSAEQKLIWWRRWNWDQVPIEVVLTDDNNKAIARKKDALANSYVSFLADLSTRCLNGEDDKGRLLQKIHADGCLDSADELTGDVGLSALQETWSDEIKSFTTRNALIANDSTSKPSVNDSKVCAELYLASLKNYKPAYKKQLLLRVKKAMPRHWERCDWYVDIGKPELSESAANLLLLLEYAPAARGLVSAIIKDDRSAAVVGVSIGATIGYLLGVLIWVDASAQKLMVLGIAGSLPGIAIGALIGRHFIGAIVGGFAGYYIFAFFDQAVMQSFAAFMHQFEYSALQWPTQSQIDQYLQRADGFTGEWGYKLGLLTIFTAAGALAGYLFRPRQAGKSETREKISLGCMIAVIITSVAIVSFANNDSENKRAKSAINRVNVTKIVPEGKAYSVTISVQYADVHPQSDEVLISIHNMSTRNNSGTCQETRFRRSSGVIFCSWRNVTKGNWRVVVKVNGLVAWRSDFTVSAAKTTNTPRSNSSPSVSGSTPESRTDNRSAAKKPNTPRSNSSPSVSGSTPELRTDNRQASKSFQGKQERKNLVDCMLPSGERVKKSLTDCRNQSGIVVD